MPRRGRGRRPKRVRFKKIKIARKGQRRTRFRPFGKRRFSRRRKHFKRRLPRKKGSFIPKALRVIGRTGALSLPQSDAGTGGYPRVWGLNMSNGVYTTLSVNSVTGDVAAPSDFYTSESTNGVNNYCVVMNMAHNLAGFQAQCATETTYDLYRMYQYYRIDQLNYVIVPRRAVPVARTSEDGTLGLSGMSSSRGGDVLFTCTRWTGPLVDDTIPSGPVQQSDFIKVSWYKNYKEYMQGHRRNTKVLHDVSLRGGRKVVFRFRPTIDTYYLSFADEQKVDPTNVTTVGGKSTIDCLPRYRRKLAPWLPTIIQSGATPMLANSFVPHYGLAVVWAPYSSTRFRFPIFDLYLSARISFKGRRVIDEGTSFGGGNNVFDYAPR